ncbi:hypothetical protein ACB092_01G205100 [Castanea dentata]
MEVVDRVDLVVVGDERMGVVDRVDLVVVVVDDEQMGVVDRVDLVVVVGDEQIQEVVALAVLVEVAAQKDLVVVDLVVEGACGDSFSRSSYTNVTERSWVEFSVKGRIGL